MDWTQTSRILLDCRKNSHQIQTKLDLVVLDRYSKAQGSQLALLTKDPDLIYTAKELGIPVFSSRKTAQQDNWRRTQRTMAKEEFLTSDPGESPRPLKEREEKDEPWILPFWARVTVFSLALLSVISILVILIPSALIIPPQSDQRQSLVIPIEANPEISSVLLSGLIPADQVEVTAEISGQKPASGIVNIPDQYASGDLLIKNLTEFPILIPEDTVFMRNDGYSSAYQNSSEIEVPGGFGSEVKLIIISVQPGTAGNAAAGTVTNVLAPFGFDLQITNPEKIEGGTNRLVSAPDAEDRQQLKKELTEQLVSAAQKKITSLISEDDLQLCDQPKLLEITQEKYSPPAGTPGARLELELRGRFGCEIVQQENLNVLMDEILNSRYRNLNQVPIENSYNYQLVSLPQQTATGSYTWKLLISWEAANQIKESEVLSELLGSKPDDAASYLQKQLDWNQAPQIQLSPSWWFRMPFLPFRIKVAE